jgi:hypothetical protein
MLMVKLPQALYLLLDILNKIRLLGKLFLVDALD